MKKLVFVFAAMFLMTGSILAAGRSEINVKAGLDFAGNLSQGKDWSGSFDVDSGFSLSGEYLYKLSNAVKVGGGLEYLISREIDAYSKPEISYMPIYATIEVSPISAARGFYLKGNLGYNILFDPDIDSLEDKSGGIYFGAGAGYVFNFGLILESMYGYYYGSATNKYQDSEGSLIYSKIGLNIGYKFKL